MINCICFTIWLFALILDLYSNHKAIKSNKKVSKQLAEDIETRNKFIKVSSDLIDAADNKSTSQDNVLWESIIVLAKRIHELESNHYV